MRDDGPLLGRDEVSLILRWLPADVIGGIASVAAEWCLAADEALAGRMALRPLRTLGPGSLKLREPTYIAVTPQGEFCVSESARHRILIYSPSGERRTIGLFGYAAGQLNYPKGLACDSTFMFVADRSNHRVQKLGLVDGLCASVVGGRRGLSDGSFSYPQGLALAEDFLFVADYGNDRIVTLHAGSLEWAFSFGGSDLELPGGIAVSGETIAVTDGARERIALYTTAGIPMRTIGFKGRGPGEFTRPLGVALRGSVLLVTEGEGQRLQVIDIEGRPLQAQAACLP